VAVVSIPKVWMGQTMQEASVKAGLRQLNPDLHFDMGTCLNIYHPFKDSRQNVYYLGRSIGAMDRGTLPEVPIWTTRRDVVEVPWSDVRQGEFVMSLFEGVTATCNKCKSSWDLPMRPYGSVICPSLCGNMGLSTDDVLFGWKNKQSQMAHVVRKVQDRIINVGWRHTFFKLYRSGVPGVTKETLEEKFGINLDPKVIDAVRIDDDLEYKFLDRKIEVA